MIIFLKKLLAICFVFRYNEEALKAKSAAVAEPADAYDSKSYGEIHMGSSPISGTRLIGNSNFYKFESNKLLTEMLVFLLFKKG